MLEISVASFEQLVLMLGQKVVQQIVKRLAQRVGAADDGAQVDEEGRESLFPRGHLDHESADVVVEVDYARLPLDRIRILLIGILIGIVVG